MIHISRTRARLAVALLLLGLASLPAMAPAARVADLYAASVPAAAASSDNAAFAEALRQVLVKASGRQAAGEAAVVRGFGDPAALVQQYRRDAAGALWVQFDPAAVRRGLAAAGLPAWGEERPTTLIWLAYDNGAGERDIVSGSGEGRLPEQLREQLLAAAAARAVPVALPLRDSPELAVVGAADIWGGFMDPVRRASARYQADLVLVGRAHLFPPGMTDVRWTLLAGADRDEWSGGIADGPGGLAERLAARLAAGSAAQDRVVLVVSGVDSFEQYGAVLACLRSVDAVVSTSVAGVSADGLRLELRLAGDRGRFEQALALRRVLEPGPAAPAGTGDTLHYRLVGQP